MTEPVSAPTAPRTRRRASRPAGPVGDPATAATGTTAVATSSPARTRSPRPAGPPPRRPAHRRLVGLIALATGLVAMLVLGALVGVLVVQQRHADAAAERDQRFVDTASQTLVNMYTFNQDNLEESVKRFVDGTSGPLHDQLSQGDNVANLTAVLRAAGGSSEAQVNGAALESVDNLSDNASVLVAVRVTPSDVDGNNQPSTPYRMRVIVHEDANGRMSVYDLMYPNGGN